MLHNVALKTTNYVLDKTFDSYHETGRARRSVGTPVCFIFRVFHSETYNLKFNSSILHKNNVPCEIPLRYCTAAADFSEVWSLYLGSRSDIRNLEFYSRKYVQLFFNINR